MPRRGLTWRKTRYVTIRDGELRSKSFIANIIHIICIHHRIDALGLVFEQIPPNTTLDSASSNAVAPTPKCSDELRERKGSQNFVYVQMCQPKLQNDWQRWIKRAMRKRGCRSLGRRQCPECPEGVNCPHKPFDLCFVVECIALGVLWFAPHKIERQPQLVRQRRSAWLYPFP